MKNYIIKISFGIILILGGILNFDIASDNIGDISGVVIGKGGKLSSSRKSKEVYYNYILAIHPDDSSLKDFDSEVSLSTYVKFSVGDRITVKDQDIPSKSKEYGFFEFISDPNLLIPLGIISIGFGIGIIIFYIISWRSSLYK